MNNFSIDDIEKKVYLIESYVNQNILFGNMGIPISSPLHISNINENKVIIIIKLIRKLYFSSKFKNNYSTFGGPSNIVLHNDNIKISIRRYDIYFSIKERVGITIPVENEKILEDLRNDINHFRLVKTLGEIYDKKPILKRNKNLNSVLKKLNKR